MPRGHWKTLTLVTALRINGLTAPFVIDGPMDGPSFLAYVEQILRRRRAKAISSSWITCALTRSTTFARRSKRSVPECVYLPAYLPDFNPIEMAFSKLKTALRKGTA